MRTRVLLDTCTNGCASDATPHAAQSQSRRHIPHSSQICRRALMTRVNSPGIVAPAHRRGSPSQLPTRVGSPATHGGSRQRGCALSLSAIEGLVTGEQSALTEYELPDGRRLQVTVTPPCHAEGAQEDDIKPSGSSSANRPLAIGGPGGRAATAHQPSGRPSFGGSHDSHARLGRRQRPHTRPGIDRHDRTFCRTRVGLQPWLSRSGFTSASTRTN